MAAPAPPPSGATAEKSQGGGKSGKMTKLIALAFIVAVIGGECLAAVLFLASAGSDGDSKHAPPKPAPAAADADGEHDEGSDDSHDSHDNHDGHDSHDSHAADEEPSDHAPAHAEPADKPLPAGPGGRAAAGDQEVDIGPFSLTVYQPASGTTLLVDFHLYGTIRSKEEASFSDRFEQHKHRIRDQIIVTIRSAEMTDLADPGLGLIKRQILEKSNALLGKRLLRSIVFSDFTFIEQ